MSLKLWFNVKKNIPYNDMEYKNMRPYCPNNSNFTFRDICCGPPIYDDCEHHCNCNMERNCNCGNPQKHCDYNVGNKPNKNCCNKKQCCMCNNLPCFCVPILNSPCSPFTFVMIGYMVGKNCNDNEFNNNSVFE